MTHKWTFKDIIDLDFFLYLRRINSFDQSDREFYLNKILPELDSFKDKKNSTSNLVLIWLKIRRNEFQKTSGDQTPGELYNLYFKSIFFICCFIFGISGFFSAFGFLSYTGTSPVNVWYYWGLFAGINLLILPFSCLPFFCMNKFNILKKMIFLFPLISIIKKIFMSSFVFAAEKISDKNIKITQSYKKIFFEDIKRHTQVLFWNFFILSQCASVLFFVGVLGGTLIKILASDLAFGWQTTLDTGPELINSIVNFIAVPWSWFVPEAFGTPGLEEIIGSKIVLKDGIKSLSTSNMTAWWPFLCLSVFFYGFIPRFCLVIFSYWFYLITLKKYPMDNSDTRALIRDLTKPDIDFKEKALEQEKIKSNRLEEFFTKNDSDNLVSPLNVKMPVKLLIPEDIYSSASIWMIKNTAVTKFGYLIEPVLKITGVSELDELEIKEGLLSFGGKSGEIVMIVQEAWQPPLKQSLDYFKWIRQLIKKNCEIILVLIGKPSPEKGFLIVNKNDYLLWNAKIKELKDPLISIFSPNIEH